jgi:fatty acid desaturase
MNNSENDILDGLVLAPVKHVSARRNLPQFLYVRNTWNFIQKLIICYSIVAGCYSVILMKIGIVATVVSIIIIGTMYAHMVELQHECLHEGVFESRKLNRFFGVILGIFMLSSYSHYKYDHLMHHAYLGTKNNKEFFNYRFANINNIVGFVLATFTLGRYIDVFKHIVNSCIGRDIVGINGKNWQNKIKNEYKLMFCLLLVTLIYTIYSQDLIFVYLWYIPALFISEAVHFLIELPEHYGLNTMNNPNVTENTRTIYTSSFWAWFTNYNNLHTAHHYHHGIPMCNVKKLHALIEEQVTITEASYWQFYKKVITGKITYNSIENCMTR